MEFREFTRIDYRGCASISMGDEIIFGNLKNISLQGMFLEMDYDVPVRSEVAVKLFDRDAESIMAKGCVVRCDKTGIGIQIQGLDAGSFSRLKTLITDRADDLDKIMNESSKVSAYVH